MLLNLHKKSWMQGLTLQNYNDHCKLNDTVINDMLNLAKNYHKVRRLMLILTCFSVDEIFSSPIGLFFINLSGGRTQ